MTRSRQPLPFAALLFAFLTACASTAPQAPVAPPAVVAAPAPTAAPAPAPAPTAAAPRLADDVVWVRDSAEYRALSAQAYAIADRRIEDLAAGRQPGTWAVSL